MEITSSLTPGIARHLSESWQLYGVPDLRLRALEDWISTNAYTDTTGTDDDRQRATARRVTFFDTLDLLGKHTLLTHLREHWTICRTAWTETMKTRPTDPIRIPSPTGDTKP